MSSDGTYSCRNAVIVAIGVVVFGMLALGAAVGAFFLGRADLGGPSADSVEVQVAALETIVAEGLQQEAATLAPAATQELLPTYTPYPTTPTPVPTVADEVFTGSLPNFCEVLNTTQEDIDGEMLAHGNEIYQNSAIGLADCAAAFEGRWYEGFPPSEDHHVTAFFGAAENTSVYQGSQWIMPVGTEPRDIVHGLAVGKCDNWDDAEVGSLPIVLDYVDMDTMGIVHLDTSCEEVRSGNPLPEEIGLVPGKALPHFRLGYTWNGDTGTGVADTKSVFTGESRFDETNKGMVCSTTADNPSLGNDDTGVAAIDSSWDLQCQYLLDGRLNGERAVMLVRGEDIADLPDWVASVWFVNPNWVALEWADQFASDNCPSELPVFVYDGQWILDHTFGCP